MDSDTDLTTLDPDDGLTAEQAATRLGVKKATLYAYVSRGVLSRRVAMDGRTSRFDEAEIDALRRRSRRVSSGELATVVASAVSEISDARLRYRDLCLLYTSPSPRDS